MSEATTTPAIAGDGAPVYWRSQDQLQNSPEFQELVAREFTEGAVEAPDDVSRRSFLSAVAASVALAGLTSCRKPKTNILPFNKRPEGFTPGIPQFYATTLSREGYGIGVLVKSSDGRPIKIEGNPQHPSSLGGCDARLQAELLQLYDPGRSKAAVAPMHDAAAADAHGEHGGGAQGAEGHGAEAHGAGEHAPAAHGGHGGAGLDNSGHAAFFAFFAGSVGKPGLAAQLVTNGGAGMHVVMPPTTSPSLLAMVQKLRDTFPKANVHAWTPLHRAEVVAGSKAAFGRALEQHVDYAAADVVVSLDCDFLALDGDVLRSSRQWAKRRREPRPDAPMSRLYVFESCYSTTGTVADNRVRATAAQIAGAAMALAAELGVGKGGALGGALTAKQASDPRIEQIAADLQAARGRSAVVVGPRMPAAVHAVAHAINAALDNHGKTVTFTAMPEQLQGGFESLQALQQAASAGSIDLLVCLDANPVHSAPADLDFAGIVRAAKNSIHVGLHRDETGQLCQWHLPLAHELESWGDALATDGTVSLRQPLVEPLFGGLSPIEFLALLSMQPEHEKLETVRDGAYGHELVRQYWQQTLGGDFETWWRRTLHDGIAQGTASRAESPQLDAAGIDALVREYQAPQGFEVHLRPCAKMWDGRYANNSWMQELPDPLTKLSWDNAALLGPRTAERLAVRNGDLLAIEAGGSSLQIPAWILPGHAEECATIQLGWGRSLHESARVAQHTGFDGFRLRSVATPWVVGGANVTKAGGSYPLACTQDHGTMAGRALVREATVAEYRSNPKFAPHMSPLDRAARLQGKGEADLAKSLWEERGYGSGGDARDPKAGTAPYQWGMVIDLNVCTGCSACVVACVAENNVPMVGKIQVRRNREMFWLRTDRYFASSEGDDLEVAENPRVANMPVPCMQCENAPCESVCPVAATMHSPEGLNDMAYNRCIGTRYCSNNCPYKVRRFNYLDYTGRTPDIKQAAFNPDVTVRSRGVMEKCTYCVQRINGGRIRAKLTGTTVGDGEGQVKVTPACAQACPTEAIHFGNLVETTSRVAQLKRNDLNYGLLSEMNTKPRTTYLGRVRNPNDLQG